MSEKKFEWGHLWKYSLEEKNELGKLCKCKIKFQCKFYSYQ